MMIGGGGNNCNRADHGIGITETDSASFAAQGSGQPEYDFGYNPAQGGDNSFSSQSYSLNLWIRWSTVILNTYLLLKARFIKNSFLWNFVVKFQPRSFYNTN